jgi:hypothetical protein
MIRARVTIARSISVPPQNPSAAQAASRLDLAAAAVRIEAAHLQAVWAQIWLARPVQFYEGDRLVVGIRPVCSLSGYSASCPAY